MTPLLAALLCASGSDWSELRQPSTARPGARPSAQARLEALDLMQSMIGQWQRERSDFYKDLERREQREKAPVEEAPPEPEVAPASWKMVEAGKGSASGRFGKVIEVAPEPTEEERELRAAEERAEAAMRKRQEDPQAFSRERQKRERREEAERLWEEAAAKKLKERQAKIEEEARRIQAELDAARRREALMQAKKLGGTLDEEGNFVDPEIREGGE